MKREVNAHLGTLDFVVGKENVIFLAPPGTARPTWPPGSASGPARPATGLPSPPPPSGSVGTTHRAFTQLKRNGLIEVSRIRRAVVRQLQEETADAV
ncbi:hypothetical protein ACWC0C_43570 [Streptomyces sp. NPDC001709]